MKEGLLVFGNLFRGSLDIHQLHCYDYQGPLNIHAKDELEKELETLHEGISVRIESPTDDRAIMWNFADLKRDIDDAAEELWQVLKSDALRAEIEAYLKHVSGQEAKDQMPPGPYMDFEPDWDEIFITIAQCYAALSASNVVGNRVWEEDVRYGIDKLATLKGMGQFIDEIKYVWDEEAKNYFKDYFQKLSYIQSQGDQISAEFKDNESIAETKGLLATILENYKSGIKPLLDPLVPTPGTPTILQVVLECYDTPIIQYILKKVKTDPKNTSIHLRIFIGVTVMNYRFFGSHETRINILRGFVILSDTKEPLRNSIRARDLLISSFRQLGTDESGETLTRFEERFKNPKAAMAKSVFTLFNICLTIQNMIAAGSNNEMNATRRIMEVAVGVGNLGVSAGAAVILARRIRGLDTTSLSALSNSLDRVAVVLSTISGALALWDAIEFTQKGEDQKALRKYIEATGGLAVIPMYTDGFPIDIIEKVVILPESVAKASSEIRTVHDIIDYYEEIKTDSPQSDDDEIKNDYLSGKKVTLSKTVVAELLREGKLLPNDNVEFYDKDRWRSFKP